jgi:iron complex outermembrane recepter protein
MQVARVGFGALGAGLLAVAAPGAQAQTQPAPDQEDKGALSEVLVTGSRIARPDYTSESPILSVSPELLQQTPSITVEQTLNLLPQFVGSYGANTAVPGKQGEAALNLRGLGTNRTLVLLDGRRLQPAAPSGEVDVNSLPISLISGVEIITGGASAIYGSDAISGVVNFKTGDIYNGFKADAKYGTSDEKGGRNRLFSASYGNKFFDSRLSAVVSVQYSDRDRLTFRDRKWFPTYINTANGLPVLYTAASGGAPYGQFVFGGNPPSQAAINQIFGQYGVAPNVVKNTEVFGVNPDGTLFDNTAVTHPIQNYRGKLNAEYQINGANTLTFALGPYVDLTNPMEQHSEFGRVTFDFTDNVKGYSQFYLDKYEVDYYGNPKVTVGAIGGQNQTPVTNPFIPKDLATLLASRADPTAPFSIVEGLGGVGTPILPVRHYAYDVMQGLLGVGGSIPSTKDWTWDTYVSFGRNALHTTYSGAVSGNALRSLLMAPDGGASLCDGGYNPFGDAPISQSCYQYMALTAVDVTTLKQTDVEASVQGGLFPLPAGDLKFAAGADYRKNQYEFNASNASASGNIVGLIGNGGSSAGDQATKEGYVEFLIPVLKDLPLIHSFDLDLAYRYSNYNTFGGSNTYHLNLDWGIIAPLHFRGGYSRAIRAPALGELYAAATTSYIDIGSAAGGSQAGDPCDYRSAARNGPNAAAVAALCVAQGVPGVATFVPPSTAAQAVNEGNPQLQPEQADTYTAGLTWRTPSSDSLWSGMSASVDYWHIKIGNAVGVVPLAVTLSRCFNYDGSNPGYSPTNYYCSLIHRDLPGILGDLTGTTVQPFLNQALMQTNGIDFEMDYKVKLGDLHMSLPGTLSLNFVGTRINHLSIKALSTSASLDYSGTTGNGQVDGASVPKFKSATTLNYAVGAITTSLRWRYLSSLRDKSILTNPKSTIRGIPAYNYLDLMGTWDVVDHVQFGWGINNVTNKQPPVFGGVAGNTDLATFDGIGRAFFLDLNVKF